MIDKHTISLLDGSQSAFSDREILGKLFSVANPAGSGPDNPVTITISSFKQLPAKYGVAVTMAQQGSWCVPLSQKNQTSFDILIYPPAGGTVNAGTIDILVFA